MIKNSDSHSTWYVSKNGVVPLVSICVITYNHEKYVRQCLDGILMQKVDFPYEILIHDDASSDDTADIIREYETKYPDVIKPLYQTTNQYSKGVDVSKFNFDRACVNISLCVKVMIIGQILKNCKYR